MRRLLPSLLVALLALALLPGRAPAAKGLEVALQDDGVFVQQSYYSRHKALQRAAQLGVTRLRVNVLWSRVAAGARARHRPKVRAYDWAPFDSLITDASRYGIKLQMTLAGTAPRWATGDHRVSNVAPDARAFAIFAGDAAQHFAGRVDRYSIWNEPNWHTWLQPSSSCRHGHWAAACDRRVAGLYRSMYRQAYAAITRADRHAQVLFGELAPQGRPGSSTPPLAFLRDATCSTRTWGAAKHCSELKADGFAQHPYAFTVQPSAAFGGPDDVVLGTLGRLTHALDKLAARRALRTPRGKRLDVYLTEHGYLSAGRRAVSQSTRATWLRRSFDIALRNPRVRELLQYLLVAPPARRDTFPTHVMTRRGGTTASYRALERWSRQHRTRIARPVRHGAAA